VIRLQWDDKARRGVDVDLFAPQQDVGVELEVRYAAGFNGATETARRKRRSAVVHQFAAHAATLQLSQATQHQTLIGAGTPQAAGIGSPAGVSEPALTTASPPPPPSPSQPTLAQSPTQSNSDVSGGFSNIARSTCKATATPHASDACPTSTTRRPNMGSSGTALNSPPSGSGAALNTDDAAVTFRRAVPTLSGQVPQPPQLQMELSATALHPQLLDVLARAVGIPLVAPAMATPTAVSPRLVASQIAAAALPPKPAREPGNGVRTGAVATDEELKHRVFDPAATLASVRQLPLYKGP
jgi:hypothetical protein